MSLRELGESNFISIDKIEEGLSNMLDKIMMDDEDENGETESDTNLTMNSIMMENLNYSRNQYDILLQSQRKKTLQNNIILKTNLNFENVGMVERKYYSTNDYNFGFQRLSNIYEEKENVENARNFEKYLIKNMNFYDVNKFYLGLQGKFSSMIMNFNGSKILQDELPKLNNETISLIFEEIYENIPKLILDQYGNYFCKIFYHFINYEEKLKFLKIIQQNFISIACHSIGNFPLQVIIENLKTFKEKRIISDAFLSPDILKIMVEDPNAAHVLEKTIMSIPENQIPLIYEFIINNFVYYSTNQNSLCVVKKIIVHMNSHQTYKQIVEIIQENFMELIMNIYSSHLIRIIIESWNDKNLQPIIKLFNNKLAKLSVQKYSSTVIEKFLERNGENAVEFFINDLIKSDKLIQLVKNNYGNFVLQKTISLSSNNCKLYLLNNILICLSRIDNRNLIVKWKHICENQFVSINKNNLINNYYSNNKFINNQSCTYDASNYSHND